MPRDRRPRARAGRSGVRRQGVGDAGRIGDALTARSARAWQLRRQSRVPCPGASSGTPDRASERTRSRHHSSGLRRTAARVRSDRGERARRRRGARPQGRRPAVARRGRTPPGGGAGEAAAAPAAEPHPRWAQRLGARRGPAPAQLVGRVEPASARAEAGGAVLVLPRPGRAGQRRVRHHQGAGDPRRLQAAEALPARLDGSTGDGVRHAQARDPGRRVAAAADPRERVRGRRGARSPQRTDDAARQLRPDAPLRLPVLLHPAAAGRRRRRVQRPRTLEGEALRGDDPADDFRRRRRDRGGGGAARRDRRLPQEPREVPAAGRRYPARRPAVRPAWDRQDAAGARDGRRGGRAVLLALGVRVRRDGGRRRRKPRARPLRAGEGGGARDHLHRRARRRRPRPRRLEPVRRPRRTRADAEPDPHRDGRVLGLGGRDRDRLHEPAGDPRPRSPAAGAVRPPRRRQPARPARPPRDPRRAHTRRAARRRRRPRRACVDDAGHGRRRPAERHQRGGAPRRAERP